MARKGWTISKWLHQWCETERWSWVRGLPKILLWSTCGAFNLSVGMGGGQEGCGHSAGALFSFINLKSGFPSYFSCQFAIFQYNSFFVVIFSKSIFNPLTRREVVGLCWFGKPRNEPFLCLGVYFAGRGAAKPKAAGSFLLWQWLVSACSPILFMPWGGLCHTSDKVLVRSFP